MVFTLNEIVLGAVRRNPNCRRPTEDEFQTVCSEWLRLSYDRHGGRRLRDMRKKNSTAGASAESNLESTAQ